MFVFQTSFMLGLNLLCKEAKYLHNGVTGTSKRIKTGWSLYARFNLFMDIGIVVGFILWNDLMLAVYAFSLDEEAAE